MVNFNELGVEPEILHAIEDLGFSSAMPVQEEVIPLLLEKDRDLIALAQTGTGKTAAYGIPIIQQLNLDIKQPQVLVLSPTRELCIQITGDLKNLAKYKPEVSVVAVYGGASIENQIKEIKQGVQIIVATPGRLIDLINRGVLKLSSVHHIILDEADEMLNMGFSEDINEILVYIPENRTTWLFSATMPSEIAAITKNYMQNPTEVVIGNKNAGAENVIHQYYVVHAKDKYFALKRIIDYSPDMYAIIFCKTKVETQEIADLLIKDGYNADSLHGDLSQTQRDYVMQRFRLKGLQLLVATDVAARGLDVTDLTHVIHYQLTKDIDTYTHRSGRTGRAGKTGISISILNLKERPIVRAIERAICKKFSEERIPKGVDICKKQLYHLINRIENTECDNSIVEELLPEAMRKIESLTKEDIIRKFLTMAFNQLFNYYKDAADLDSPLEERKKEQVGNIIEASEGFVRFFINIGKIDGVKPVNIIGLINDYIPGKKVKIGKIEVTKTCSFVEVDETLALPIMKALKRAYYRNRRIEINIADGVVAPRRSKNGERKKERKHSYMEDYYEDFRPMPFEHKKKKKHKDDDKPKSSKKRKKK